MNQPWAIKIVRGARAGRIFKLSAGVCSVGSARDCDVVLTDPWIAPHHVTIIPRAGGYNLVDLTAEMDVKVNNTPVKSRKLALGDRISIGETVLEIVPWEESAPLAIADVVSTVAAVPEETGESIDEEAVVPAENEEKTVLPPTLTYSGVDNVLKEQRLRKERRIRLAIAAAVIAAIGMVVALSLSYVSAEKNRLRRRYDAARVYASSHPADFAGIISRYEEVRAQATGLDARLEKALAEEIARVRAQMDAAEKKFQAALAEADEKAGALAKTEDFEDALAVYQPDDAALRAKFAAARAGKIAELRQKAAAKAAAMKEEAARRDAEQIARLSSQAEEMVRKLAKIVALSCVEGKTAAAMEEIEKALRSESMAAYTNRLAEVLTAVRVLGSVDSTFAGSGGTSGRVAPLPDEDSAHVIESLPPPVRLVFAIRKNDLASARELSKNAGDNLLVEGLRPLVAAMEETAARSSEARAALAEIWTKAMGAMEPLPSPKECETALRRKLNSPEREKALRLAMDITNFAAKHADTATVREYAPLIALAASLSKGKALPADAFSGLGDGRIIEIDGDKYYVETSRDVTDTQGLRMGLCKPQVLYTAPGTNVVVAAHVDVYSVVPFQSLSERQFVFSVLAGAKQQTPALGDMVLVGKDIQTGPRFVVRERMSGRETVFTSDFERKIDQEWRAANDVALALDNGRLAFDMPGEPRRMNPETGDLELAVDAGSSSFVLAFDVQRRPEKSLVVGIGSLEVVLGDAEGRRQGIYANGRLIRSVDVPRPVMGAFQRVSITRSRSLARLDAAGVSCACSIPQEVGGQDVKRILFYHTGRMLIDNVSVQKIVGSGNVEVAGVSQDKRDILIGRTGGGEWEMVGPGTNVYIFPGGTAGEGALKAAARVYGAEGGWLIARLEKPVDILPNTVVSLTPSVAIDDSKDEYESGVAVNSKRLSPSQVLLGFPKGGNVVLLDSAGTVPDTGFVHPVRELLVSPTTREVLAAVPGDGVRCQFLSHGLAVKCNRADGREVGGYGEKAVLISRLLLPPGRTVDVGGGFLSYTPGSGGGSKDMWKPLNGDWRDKMGRWVGTPGILSDGPPVCQFDDMFGEVFQFDLEFKIEKQTAPPAEDWMKDVIFEVYFPASRAGGSIALGCGGRAGLNVQGHAIRAEKGAKAVMWPGPPPKGFNTKSDTDWTAGAPALKAGQSYLFRIRRAADVLAFYINGKRLVRIADVCFVGGAIVRVAAPGAVVSIGKVSVTELSRSTCIPDSEPILGEFGYVAGVVGGQMITDADAKDILPGAKLSLMDVEKVIEGAASKTAMLRRVATTSVSEVGKRTARAACADEWGVKAGMKVLTGTLPSGSQTFSDARLKDIDLGL